MTEQNVETAEMPKLEVEVDFGNVSIGEDVARIGVEIDRERLTLELADKFFSGSRLKVGLMAVPKGELKGQKHFEDMSELIEGEVDVKSFSVQSDKFKTGIKFGATAISLLTLVGFRKRPGKLFATWIGDAASHDEDEFDPDEREFEAGKDRPVGQPFLKAAAAARKGLAGSDADPAKEHKLETLEKPALKKLAKQMGATYEDQGLSELQVGAIKEAFDIKTIPHFENIINSDPFWHQKINRFGEKAIDKTSDALMFFRSMVGYPSDDSTAESDSNAESPGYMTSDVPDNEAYTLGANAAVAAESSDDPPTNPFHPATRAAECWQKGFNETDGGGLAVNASQGNEDAGTMFDDEHTEDVDDDSDDSEETEAE